MLKLSVLKVSIRCSKHPNFQPREGAGAVKGNCERCNSLVKIFEAHAALMRLISETPVREYDRRPAQAAPDTRQQQLF